MKKCNPIVDLSKFPSNKKILSGVLAISYNQVYSKLWHSSYITL